MIVKAADTFFVSDTHFGHQNAINMCHRPWMSADEMNDALVSIWNQRVPKGATVFLLGDVSFMSPERTVEVLKRLHGSIYLVLGNHDKVCRREAVARCFENSDEILHTPNRVFPIREVVVREEPNKKQGEKGIVLSHFPIESWNGRHRGRWHLHGHSHGTSTPVPHRADVGVDTPLSQYGPVPFSLIQSVMG